jgi:hypothetical protein
MFYRQKMDMTSVTNQNMIKSVFCRSVTGEGGCLAVGGRCRFAHTINELRPRLCKYRDRCNKHKDHPKTCKFVHPDEDIYDYAITHGFYGNITNQRGNTTVFNNSDEFNHIIDDFPRLNISFNPPPPPPPSSPIGNMSVPSYMSPIEDSDFSYLLASPIDQDSFETINLLTPVVVSPISNVDFENDESVNLDQTLHNGSNFAIFSGL